MILTVVYSQCWAYIALIRVKKAEVMLSSNLFKFLEYLKPFSKYEQNIFKCFFTVYKLSQPNLSLDLCSKASLSLSLIPF